MTSGQQRMERTDVRRRGGTAVIGGGLIAAVLGGCTQSDSFWDPSILGRWERTPTQVPILERLAAIEDDTGALVEYSEVSADDLAPQADEYVISAGDQITVTIYDLVVIDRPEILPRIVDQGGFVELPQLGRLLLAGLTQREAREAIVERATAFIRDPLVDVLINSRRALTYTLQGNVPAAGIYTIPTADYKLLEALVAGGGLNEATSEFVFVIRQVALDSDLTAPGANGGNTGGPASGGQQPGMGDPSAPARPVENDPEALIDLIDELTAPDGDGAEFAPSAMHDGVGSGALSARSRQATLESVPPPVDLIDATPEPQRIASPAADAPGSSGVEAGRWLFLNGEWVRAAPGRTADDADGVALLDGPSGLVTQRVIRVPAAPLLAGDARFNIVVRAGDVIRVPPPETGNIYMSGQVARPGVYTLPITGRLTLERAIAAAGGLTPIAIPERVDLTRMVGPNRQATIMLDLRAIAERTQPDVFLKPNDYVNIGTNFWATPLAVLRGGLRASYGFGFLLDRNFGNDVFGAPPTNVGNN